MFRVVEVGAGAGGLTRDALPLLDDGLNAELLQYMATDINNAYSSSLLDAVRSPKLQFKVGHVVAHVQCEVLLWVCWLQRACSPLCQTEKWLCDSA